MTDDMNLTSEPERPRVLVVDDSEDIQALIRFRLRGEDLNLYQAFDAEDAFKQSRELKPDLLLLDLNLPGQSGLELIHRLKDEHELSNIPVIFLTGTDDVTTKVQAFDAGAVDYITKPFDGVELCARVRAALRTKRYLDLLATRAQLDGLTGLWNRSYFDDRLRDECAVSQRHKRPVSLIMLDIDHFKSLNDRFGHPFGDQVLQRVAQTLLATTRRTEIACRYGGEEFAVILRETDLEGAIKTASRIRVAIESLDFRSEAEPVKVTASLGASSSDVFTDVFEPNDLMASADQALYKAKHGGRNQVCRA